MAILDSLLGVEVTVWSEGSQLDEYDDVDDVVRQKWRHKTVSKYIESVTDAGFFFRLRVGRPYEHDCDELGFAIILDGCEENVDSHLCSPQNLEYCETWENDVHGVETLDEEGAKLKRFTFSKLLTSEGETRYITPKEIEDFKNIGQIEVRVYQLEHCRTATRKPQPPRGSLGTIPEKVFGNQAISHSISYEAEEALSAPSLYRGTKYMHGWDGPIGIFRFKYRSRGDLQRSLIIPRTPTPEPSESPSAAGLTSEQKSKLARMKFDDIEMLESLTGARKRAVDQNDKSPRHSFEDLSPEEIDLLALQKHAEMTPEPGTTIKQEPGIGILTSTGRSRKHRRPYSMVSIAGGKRALDLTIDNDRGSSNRVDPRFSALSNGSSSSTPASPTGPVDQAITQPIPKTSVLATEGDQDQIEICEVRRVKKPKGGKHLKVGREHPEKRR